MQFRNLAVGVHCLLIYILTKRSDFKSLDWTETSIEFHHVFNPIGLMLLAIHVREIANN